MIRQYWISNAAQEHVNVVRDKGYTQINMGPREPLEKMNVGDWIIYYSPTIHFEQKYPICQKFTGIACVNDNRIYPQGNQQPDHWRRNVDFFHCIPHLATNFIGKVSFLPDHDSWIETLSKPIFEIKRQDFITIAEKIITPNANLVLLY